MCTDRDPTRRPVRGIRAVLVAVLALLASCDRVTAQRSAIVAWPRVDTVYFHPGVAIGPVLSTNTDGSSREERRYEPFGQPIDARTSGGVGPVDFSRDPQNSLGKLTDPATGWSYHGARWLQPQSARWTAPDPAVAAPEPKHLTTFWDLNPYHYARQNPALFRDPDGREVPDDVREQAWAIRHGDEQVAKAVDDFKQARDHLRAFEDRNGMNPGAGPLGIPQLRDPLAELAKVQELMGAPARIQSELAPLLIAGSVLGGLGASAADALGEMAASNAIRGRFIYLDQSGMLINNGYDAVTTTEGQIFVRPGLDAATRHLSIEHEFVHRFFTPLSGPLRAFRAGLGQSAYNQSHFLKFMEESMAEGYAQGSIRAGLSYGLNRVAVPRLLLEGGAYVGGVAGGSYAIGKALSPGGQ